MASPRVVMASMIMADVVRMGMIAMRVIVEMRRAVLDPLPDRVPGMGLRRNNRSGCKAAGGKATGDKRRTIGFRGNRHENVIM